MIQRAYGPGVRWQDVARYLDARMEREPGTKIQYGHPSPRFWDQRSEPIERLLEPREPDRDLTLYLHVPFCPPTTPGACGFCLFAREDLDSYGLVESYLTDLRTELEHCAESVGPRRLAAVYFGGGTPNVLKPADIRRAVDGVRALFDVPPETEITFEGTPALFTPDRLEALGAVGVNRISVGAQVLKPELIRHSGRRQRPDHVRATVEFCRDHGIHCSVDLVTGWFDQTPEDVLADVDLLADWGATGIVNHPLTLAGDSAFARRSADLPPVALTCTSFLAARERLLERGYRADSYTDYRRADRPPVAYLERYRDVLGSDRVGVGYGANSLLAGTLERPGHTHKNVAGIASYREAVRTLAGGGSCADALFRFESVDLALLFVLKGLEGTPRLSERAYAAAFGGDLRADFAAFWEALERRGWLMWEDDRPTLTGAGVFFTATVQRCIAEPRNAVLRGEPSRLGPAESRAGGG